jgi:tetratricopeptide (TPR) repeat protein
LAKALGNQGVIHQIRGDLDASEKLFAQAATLCRESESKADLSRTLSDLASIYMARKDWGKAIAALKEREQVCLELNDAQGLQLSRHGIGACLAGQTERLYETGELDAALSVCKEEERIARESNHRDSLLTSLRRQVQILVDKGRAREALPLIEEEERLHRESSDRPALADCLLTHAIVIGEAKGDTGVARAKCDEALEIGNALGMSVEAMEAKALLFRTGKSRGDMVAAAGIVILLLLLLSALGAGLALWKPSLWFIGWPLAGLSILVLLLNILSLLPSVNKAMKNYAQKLQSGLDGGSK